MLNSLEYERAAEELWRLFLDKRLTWEQMFPAYREFYRLGHSEAAECQFEQDCLRRARQMGANTTVLGGPRHDH